MIIEYWLESHCSYWRIFGFGDYESLDIDVATASRLGNTQGIIHGS
jgi:hypothetical protein